MIRCELWCCFRMFEHPFWTDFLSDQYLGDEMDDAVDYAVCTATKDAWTKETSPEHPIDPDHPEYIYGNGVPWDCPFYQREIKPPWEAPARTLADSGVEKEVG